METNRLLRAGRVAVLAMCLVAVPTLHAIAQDKDQWENSPDRSTGQLTESTASATGELPPMELLPACGCREVVLIQAERKSRRKTDRRDAHALSELLWVNRDAMLSGRKVKGVRRVVPPTADDRDDRRLTQLRRDVVSAVDEATCTGDHCHNRRPLRRVLPPRQNTATPPLPEELANCRPWLVETIDLLRPRVFVALGQIAWKSLVSEFRRREWFVGRPGNFGHGAVAELNDDCCLIGSYHPSQQNTFTGKLTEPMLDAVFAAARQRLASPAERK